MIDWEVGSGINFQARRDNIGIFGHKTLVIMGLAMRVHLFSLTKRVSGSSLSLNIYNGRACASSGMMVVL